MHAPSGRGLAAVAGSLMAGALVAGCGSTPAKPPAPPAPADASAAASASPSPVFGHGGPGQAGGNTDQSSAVTITTYGSGNPCSGTGGPIVPLGQGPSACTHLWAPLNVTYTAGDGYAASLPWPRTVSVGPGASATQAAAEVQAYVRLQSLLIFGDQTGAPEVIKAAEPAFSWQADDIDNAVVNNGVRAQFPSCFFPYAFRAVALDKGAISAMQDNSWPSPTSTALIAYYHACPAGVTLNYPDGSTRTVRQNAPADALVIAGAIVHNDTFGAIWQTSGEVFCGDPRVATVCGASAS